MTSMDSSSSNYQGVGNPLSGNNRFETIIDDFLNFFFSGVVQSLPLRSTLQASPHDERQARTKTVTLNRKQKKVQIAKKFHACRAVSGEGNTKKKGKRYNHHAKRTLPVAYSLVGHFPRGCQRSKI